MREQSPVQDLPSIRTYRTEKASVRYKKQPPTELLQSQLDQLGTLPTAPG